MSLDKNSIKFELFTVPVVEIANTSPNEVMDVITLVEFVYQIFISSESFPQESQE